MTIEETSAAYIILLALQCVHSLEELSTGFHKKWYLFTMPFVVFLVFELLFQAFCIFVFFSPEFPYRITLMAFFNLLMFANGVQHLVWAGVVKKYVPGLVTAPLFIATFLLFYF